MKSGRISEKDESKDMFSDGNNKDVDYKGYEGKSTDGDGVNMK